MIEIVHNLSEPFSLLANDVAGRNLHILKCDVGRSRGPHAHALHVTALDARHGFFHQQHRDALRSLPSSTHRNGEVVGPDAIGNPLLGSVDDVEVAFALRRGADVGHIAASPRLGDGEAYELIAPQAGGGDFALELLTPEVEDWGETDGDSCEKGPHNTPRSAPCKLIDQDQLVEGVEAPLRRCNAAERLVPRRADNPWHQSSLVELLEDVFRELVRLIPFVHVGFDHFLHELPHSLSPFNVGVGVVWAVVSLIPRRISPGNLISKWLVDDICLR
mmetsp:Transcript_23462/g.37811  ORF Transcript_23462/g.37811 Transcript_23462/m.37811 type:complete len:275 (-) Transcript_23462:388-1212(-)